MSDFAGDELTALSELLGRSYTGDEVAEVLCPTLRRLLTVASREALAEGLQCLLDHRAEWPESRFDRPDPSRLPTPPGQM